MKKIVHIIPPSPSEKLVEYVLHLYKNFSEEFKVYCIQWVDNNSNLEFNQELKNIMQHRYRFLPDLDEGLDMLKFIDPDIIHFHDFPETYINFYTLCEIYRWSHFAELAKERNYKITVTPHTKFYDYNQLRFLADKFILPSYEWMEIFNNYFSTQNFEVYERQFII